MGVSLVPQMATAIALPQVVYRHLQRPQPKRTIAIITRSKRPLKLAALECLKSLRRAGTKFEELLKEQARKSSEAELT
jgi:rRNA-processing protein FCF1